MARTKKKLVEEKTTSLPPASQMAQNAAAEELLLLLQEEPAEDTAEPKEEKTEKTDAPDTEKEEMRRLLSRLMDDMGASSLSALSEMIDRAETEKLVHAHGLSEEAAKLFLAQQEKVRALREGEKAAAREAVYAEMRRDPLYEDVDTYREAVEALVFRTGLSPKEAYNALFAEARAARLRAEFAEKEALAEKKAKRIPALSGGDASSEDGSARLTEMEKWAAKNAGMTPAEYARYKYGR